MYHVTEEYLQIPCVGITEPSQNSVQLIVTKIAYPEAQTRPKRYRYKLVKSEQKYLNEGVDVTQML